MLVTRWSQRDAGRILEKSVDQRTYTVGDEYAYIDYLERTFKETESWVGLTESAAMEAITLNQQPTDGGKYSYDVNETNRATGSYQVTRYYERKVTDVAGESPPPVLGSVAISPSSNYNIPADGWPVSVSLSVNSPQSEVVYRIDYLDGATQIEGEWRVISAGSYGGSINVNTNSKYAYGTDVANIGRVHRLAIIYAYERQTLVTGDFIGSTSSATYSTPAPNLSRPAISGGNTSLSVNPDQTPTTITVSGGGTDEGYNTLKYGVDSNGNWHREGDESQRSGVPVQYSTDTTYIAGGVNLSGVGNRHKVWREYAWARKTLNGVKYFGNSSEALFAQVVPQLGSVTFNPAPSSTGTSGRGYCGNYWTSSGAYPNQVNLSVSGYNGSPRIHYAIYRAGDYGANLYYNGAVDGTSVDVFSDKNTMSIYEVLGNPCNIQASRLITKCFFYYFYIDVYVSVLFDGHRYYSGTIRGHYSRLVSYNYI